MRPTKASFRLSAITRVYYSHKYNPCPVTIRTTHRSQSTTVLTTCGFSATPRMGYDRGVVINCIKRHYELLVKAAYFDPAEVRYPPDEGWSDEQLAVDVLRAFGRSEEVVDLLRHLPYIKQLDSDDRDEVWFQTRHLSYLRDTWPCKSLTAEKCLGRNLSEKLMMPGPEDWPAGFISLTQDQHGTWWIIDTAKGSAMLSIHANHQRSDIYPRYPTSSRTRLHRSARRRALACGFRSTRHSRIF